MEETVVWVNGHLRHPGEPVVSALDHGLTVGDGVFETCGVLGGKPFALSRHLERLTRSAVGLGLTPPDLELVRAGVAAVLEGRTDLGRLRVTVTAGLGPPGSGRSPGSQTVVVIGAPAQPSASSRVVRVPWVRNERSAIAGLKTISYAESVVALARAHEQGADEALLANTAGDLCEGTGANVFVERDGELLTPSLASGCLAGITRELVLEWSEQEALPVREARIGELPYSVLDDVGAGRAQLALTGSVRTVVPVVELDGVPVEVGPLTLEVQRMYHEREAEQIDP